jgi:alkylation response protein AidB-like acyl-CoA dehydrogenase
MAGLRLRLTAGRPPARISPFTRAEGLTVPTRAPIAAADLEALAGLADAADEVPSWPEASWAVLRRAGVLAWAVPREYGGEERSALELLEGYEQLAGACLTTAFLLSQREAACRRLVESGQEALCGELLPALARGERFATVGLSQLTTSRQHTGPSLVVRSAGPGLVLDGVIPWVTGAERADHLVIGAVLEDGRQVLAVLPAGLPGVSVGPPLPLAALRGSVTAEVRCDGVALDQRWLLTGPAERVLKPGRSGGGLETSCLALGLAGAAIARLEQEATARPGLAESVRALRERHGGLRAQMHRLAAGAAGAEAVALRAKANALVLSATQATLTASKGTGFVRGHPAQRWARQALFFLVWSCPWPAASATLAHLSAAPQPPGCV